MMAPRFMAAPWDILAHSMEIEDICVHLNNLEIQEQTQKTN